MSENNFNENLFFGTKKYRYLLESLYKRYSYDNRYVFIDKSRFSTLVQQRLKTDTVIQKDAEESNGIEEKVVSWPTRDYAYSAFFLETKSCTNPGYESDGWMKTSVADYLLYAFEIKDIGLDVYIIDFPQLQQWFWEREKTFKYSRLPGKNRTAGRIVEIYRVTACIPTERFLVYFDGSIEPLKTVVNITRYRDHILRERSRQKIDEMLAVLPQKQVEEEGADIESDDAEESDWYEVYQRVEEILAVREMEDFLQWVDKMQQPTLWEDETS